MKFPNWPKTTEKKDIKLGLDRIKKLLERVGNPHELLPPTIHIAGTNGKGSTLAYLNNIFSNSGYKVHKYSSPHLVEFNERIVLAGKEIEDELLNKLLEECQKAAETKPEIKVTFFEGVTVAAFLAFSREKADILLLETGMGGRLDATNVITKPIATIISSISLDHTEFLGKTLKQIAAEKAGIIKKSSPVIVGQQSKEVMNVIKKEAKKQKAQIYSYSEDWEVKKEDNQMIFKMADQEIHLPIPSLLGYHQLENAGNAITTLLVQDQFSFNGKKIKDGLKTTKWPARLQKISYGKLFDSIADNFQLYLDGGHNEAGAKAIASWINSQNMEHIRNDVNNHKIPTYVILGMLKDKDGATFLKYISGSVDFLVGIEIKGENSKTAEEIAKEASNAGIKAVNADNIQQALEYIATIHSGDKEDKKKSGLLKKIFNKKPKIEPARILVCGSLYLAGQFIEENTV